MGPQICDAVEKFKPVLYFHSKEGYKSIDYSEVLKECKLKHVITGQIVREEVDLDGTTLGKWMEEMPHINAKDHTLFLPNGMSSDCIANHDPTEPELTRVPVYVRTRAGPNANEIYISYAHMYAYNGPVGLFQSNWKKLQLKSFTHYADLEHVTYHVRWDGEKWYMLRAYYEKHGGGSWVHPSNLDYENDRPVVYVALNTHASLEKPKNYWRFAGFVADKGEKGVRWDPETCVILRSCSTNLEEDLRWTLFKGYLGNDHVSGFPSKDWWNDDEENESYDQGCNCCFQKLGCI